jgi:hypothetical protein
LDCIVALPNSICPIREFPQKSVKCISIEIIIKQRDKTPVVYPTVTGGLGNAVALISHKPRRRIARIVV